MNWLAITVAAVLIFAIVYRLALGAPAAAPEDEKKKPEAEPAEASGDALPTLGFDEDEDVDPTQVGTRTTSLTPPTVKIVYDEDALLEEPTRSVPLILVTATGATDKGLRRKRNEDSVLVLDDEDLFVVADGMGGYRGGEIASKLAVSTIEQAFSTQTFEGAPHQQIPGRASELARAVQMANEAILGRASQDRRLEGMGTTICAARFSRKKQRLYVAHVGDSRMYCFRDGALHRMTTDHTMADFGVVGEGAGHLSRAVGVWPTVPIDVILGKPRAGDLYVLCSDGLTKMVGDDEITRILAEAASPRAAVDQLIGLANDHGGKDNVSVVIVRVDDPTTSSAAA